MEDLCGKLKYHIKDYREVSIPEMRICIVGPGLMPIPPTGWGAVEILIWDYKLALEKFEHEVLIVNTQNPVEMIEKINKFRPHFVHIQYDDYVQIYPYIQYPCIITTHFSYIEQPNKWNDYGGRVAAHFQNIKPKVFCLSSGIRDVYRDVLNIPSENLYVVPNGVNTDNFRKSNEPKHCDASIYLAKIDYRKRQHMFQSIDSLWYAGNIADNRFDQSKNYLGEWSKRTLYDNLTEYGNLVLLSDGEAHPLVCLEAFASGLGVVVSQWAAANLDVERKFITVIPEEKISDIEYVESKIIENRNYSINNRKEIFRYSREFDWVNIVENYYLPAVNNLLINGRY